MMVWARGLPLTATSEIAVLGRVEVVFQEFVERAGKTFTRGLLGFRRCRGFRRRCLLGLRGGCRFGCRLCRRMRARSNQQDSKDKKKCDEAG